MTGRMINSSLMEGVLILALKQAVVHALLKKPSLEPTALDNHQPVSDFLFLGVIERVVGSKVLG